MKKSAHLISLFITLLLMSVPAIGQSATEGRDFWQLASTAVALVLPTAALRSHYVVIDYPAGTVTLIR